MLLIISVLLGCSPYYMVSGHHSPFFYSLPVHHGFQAALPPQLFHHSSPAFAPIFNPLPHYYSPQPLIYPPYTPIRKDIINNAPLENIAPTPYQGFAYRTHLNDDAITNAFFVSGPFSYEPGQIEQFLLKAQKNENEKGEKKSEKETETTLSFPNAIQNIFSNPGNDFQYIYHPSLLPFFHGRNIDAATPFQQRFGEGETKKLEQPTTTTTEATTASATEDSAQEGRTVEEESETEHNKAPTTLTSSSSPEATPTDSPAENTDGTTVSEST